MNQLQSNPHVEAKPPWDAVKSLSSDELLMRGFKKLTEMQNQPIDYDDCLVAHLAVMIESVVSPASSPFLMWEDKAGVLMAYMELSGRLPRGAITWKPGDSKKAYDRVLELRHRALLNEALLGMKEEQPEPPVASTPLAPTPTAPAAPPPVRTAVASPAPPVASRASQS